MQQTSKNWKRDAMKRAGVISDAFEVFKAWLAHFANWILFFCLIGNILQTVISLGSDISGVLLCIQCVMLDVAGASLYTMAQHAKSEGNEKGAKLAMNMSIILIVIMTITALNGTLNAIFPALSWLVQDVNYGLIFARIVIVVLYGNIVHQLNTSTEMHDNRIEELEQAVQNLRDQLNTEQQRVSNLTVQSQREVSNLRVQSQSEVSNLTAELENEQQKVSNLQAEVSNLTVQSQKEVQGLQAEVSNLQVQLDTKESQLTILKKTMDSGTKWHESNTEALVSSVQSQLVAERAKVSSLQKELDGERAKVSNLTVQSQSEVSNLTVQSQREVSNLRIQLENEQKKVSNLEAEVSNLTVQSQSEVSNLQAQLDSEQQRVQSLIAQLDKEKQKVSTLQEKLNPIPKKETEERVIQLDTNRVRRNRQDAEEKAMIEEIRKLLAAEPDLTARAIATRVGCSPTTASKWKELIEKERKEA